MTKPIEITLSPESIRYADMMSTMPDRMLRAMARGLDRANEITVGRIQQKRLSGRGPYPAIEGRLGIVTGRYRSSLRRSRAVIQGTTVTGAIGTNVVYAGIHEFGGTIKHPARAGVVRLRTDKNGNLVMRGNLATFAKATHKLAREVKFSGHAYEVKMPARAPIGHGIADANDEGIYRDAIGQAMREAWEGKQS